MGWSLPSKQRFFAVPNYVPKVYGYLRGEGMLGQRVLVKRYCVLRGLGEPTFVMEPKSKKAIRAPIRQRPLQVCDKLRPTDHIIVARLDVLTANLIEVPDIELWMGERGIRWHVVDFGGCSIDSGTVAGRQFIATLGLCRELLTIEYAGKWESVRARARAAKRYAGAGVPVFCKLVPCEGGKRLEFHDWALSLMELSACGHNIIKELRYIWKHSNLTQHNAERIARKMRTFYMAWTYFQKPDINTVVIADMIAAYKERVDGV